MEFRRKIAGMKIRLIFIIAFILLPLSGCAFISVGYNYADLYLRYSINSYATFNDAQKLAIENEVNVFMKWHRKNMLPEYVIFLQELKRTAQSGVQLKKQDVGRFRAEIRALYIRTMQPTIRPSASLLSGIDPEQIQDLIKSLARENNKKKEKELSGSLDEQLRKRAEKTIDFLESLVGDLSEAQLGSIHEMSRKLPFATSTYIRLQEENQARLIELLKNNKSEEDIATFLTLWLITPEANRSPEEQGMMMAFENASDEMFANISQLLTASQKEKFQKSIQKYIDTFQELSRK